jgi:general secretion pathway protein E
LKKTNTILKLESLGFRGEVLKRLDEMSHQKHGMVYVSGPTGHGKTTTLFAMLDRINTPDRMIITVEDPVEYEVAGISQIQVNHKNRTHLCQGLALHPSSKPRCHHGW